VSKNEKKYYLAFGQHLQSLIEKYETDVVNIASIANIEQKQVYRVLNGEHGASMKTIIALAKGLGIPPKELFDFHYDLNEK
jgi:predicted transcriptional regulator